MHRRHIAAAAIQLLAHDRVSLGRAWPNIAQQIRAAASAGAKLVVLPEGTLPAYVLGPEPFEAGEIAEALAACAQLACELRIVLVVGAARAAGNQIFNSAMVFDADGSLAGSADKHFLWHFDRQWFARGERLQPIRTSLGVLGVLICADGRIPTIARALVDRGAELLVMPTAWVTSGRDPANLENIQADLLARVRARENGVPFIAANKCGVELRSVAYCGKSQVVHADGAIAAIASETQPEILAAEIELGSRSPMRTRASLPEPNPQNGGTAQSLRIAITAYEGHAQDENLMRILEAGLLIAPETARSDQESFSDDVVHDPGGLAAHRLAGKDIAVWLTAQDDGWQVSFARARAVELRIYVVVLDTKAKRAYAVDPDGAIVCGTYDGYEITHFTYDPARTRQTLVAPGTDVREGLERAHADAR
jgi:predicted amidohydrolase